MTPDITLDSVVFTKVSDDGSKSTRRNTALGLQSPRTMVISHQDGKDSRSGEQVVRTGVSWQYATPVGTPAIRSIDGISVALTIPESSTPARMQELIDVAIAALSSSTFITSLLNREI